MSEITILVIEDDPAVRCGIVDLLEYPGYKTLEATDGHSGMKHALKSNFRLLLLDLVMPGPPGSTSSQRSNVNAQARPSSSRPPARVGLAWAWDSHFHVA